MKKKNPYLIRTLICLGLAVFLLLSQSSFASRNQAIQAKKKAGKTEKSDSETSEEENTVLQEYVVEAVVPALPFLLHHSWNLIFCIDFPIDADIFYPFEESHPIISYLANTFCHLIAINAP